MRQDVTSEYPRLAWVREDDLDLGPAALRATEPFMARRHGAREVLVAVLSVEREDGVDAAHVRPAGLGWAGYRVPAGLLTDVSTAGHQLHWKQTTTFDAVPYGHLSVDGRRVTYRNGAPMGFNGAQAHALAAALGAELTEERDDRMVA